MLDVFRELIANQYAAALCTVHLCIDKCPDAAWNAPVGTHPFSLVAFHTLFFADYYLGRTPEAIREQAFHKQHAAEFGDYEELQSRNTQSLYEKSFVADYLQHCREKARAVIAEETAESLSAPAGFGNRPYTRAELHVYNIRHIQHHAAQLSLRLRIDHDVDVPWVGSGWRDDTD